MKNFGLLFIGIVVVLSMVLASCGAPATVTQTATATATTTQTATATATATATTTQTATATVAAAPINVGVLGPFSGHGSKEANLIQQGINFAIKKIGGSINGRPIIIKIEDETDAPDQATAKAKKLVEQDKVVGIIGPLNGQNVPAIDAFSNTVPIANVGYSERDPSYKYMWNWAGNQSDQMGAAGTYVYDEMGKRKAAVIYQQFNYGINMLNNFSATFTAKGGTISSKQAVPFGTVDLSPYLSKLGDADVIVVLLVSPSDVSFVKQYKELGIKLPVMWGESWPQGSIEYLVNSIGPGIVGMYGQQAMGALIDTPANKAYVAEFKAMFGVDPSLVNYTSSNATYLMLTGIKMAADKGPVTTASVLAALDSIKQYDSLIGPIPITNRTGYLGTWINQAVQVDAKTINWKPVKYYETKAK